MMGKILKHYQSHRTEIIWAAVFAALFAYPAAILYEWGKEGFHVDTTWLQTVLAYRIPWWYVVVAGIGLYVLFNLIKILLRRRSMDNMDQFQSKFEDPERQTLQHEDVKPHNVRIQPLRVDPPSTEIPDPSDKNIPVSNLVRQDRSIDARWDPKGDKGEPDVLMLPEFDGALFSRLRFHLTVKENEFNFVFKLMSERGSPIHGPDLFNVMDEVALDFRLLDGVLTMYYREHKSHIVVPLRPATPTDLDVSIHVMSVRGKMVLQVNGGGTVLYGVPVKPGVRKKAALITWSHASKPYHMSFTEMRYATSTG